jgi:cell division protein FtsA
MGALVIDIGGGTTEYVVYGGGIIKHTGVLAVGGDHISNDLAYGLKVPLGRAEQLKIEYGGAFMEDSVKGRSVTLPNENGLPERTINMEHLRRIMAARVEEIFQLIEQELSTQGLLDHLRCGVLLCGGGANIPGVHRLSEGIFQLPTSLGRTNSISGLKSALDHPEFTTGIGLVKFGSFQQKKKSGALGLSTIKQSITEFFKRS